MNQLKAVVTFLHGDVYFAFRLIYLNNGWDVKECVQ